MRPVHPLYLIHAILCLTTQGHATSSPSLSSPSVDNNVASSSSSSSASSTASPSMSQLHGNGARVTPFPRHFTSAVRPWADLRPPDQCLLFDPASDEPEQTPVPLDPTIDHDELDPPHTPAETQGPEPPPTEIASVTAQETDEEEEFVSFEEWKRMKEIEEDAAIGPVSSVQTRSPSESPSTEGTVATGTGESLSSLAQDDIPSTDNSSALLNIASSIPSPSPPPSLDSTSSSSSSLHSSSSTSSSSRDTAASKDASPRVAPHAHRYNYASPDCSARIHSSSPSTQHASSLLHKSRDRYMLTPCRAGEHWVVIELCDEIRVEAVEIAVWEFFSGVVKDVRVSVGGEDEDEEDNVDDNEEIRDGEVDGESEIEKSKGSEGKGRGGRTGKKNGWTEVGAFVTKNIRGVQSFVLPEPTSFHRFLRLDFPTFYGNEYYCPVSQLKVYGMNQMEAFKWEQRRLSAASDRGWARDEAARERERRDKEKREESERRVREEAQAKREKEEEEKRESELNELEKLVHEQVARMASSAETGSVVDNETLVAVSDKEAEAASAVPSGSSPSVSGNKSEKVSASFVSNDSDTTSLPPNSSTAVTSTVAAATSSEDTKSASSTTSSSSATSAVASSSASSASSPLESNATSSSGSTSNASASMSPSTASTGTSSLPSTGTTTVTTSSSSTTTVRPPTRSDSSESIYAFIIRRLTALEGNGTLVARYVEEQGRALRALISRSEARWATRRLEWEDTERVRWERERMRYEDRFGRVVSQLESMRISMENERRILESQLRLLADELGWERRRSFAQMLVLIIVIVLGALTRIDVIDAVLRPIIDDARRRRKSLRRRGAGKGKMSVSGDEDGEVTGRPLSVGPLAGLRIDVNPTRRAASTTDIELSDLGQGSNAVDAGGEKCTALRLDESWAESPPTRNGRGSTLNSGVATPLATSAAPTPVTATPTAKFRPSSRGSGNRYSRPTTPNSLLSPSHIAASPGGLSNRRRSANPGTPSLGLGLAGGGGYPNVPRSASMSDYPGSGGLPAIATMPHSPVGMGMGTGHTYGPVHGAYSSGGLGGLAGIGRPASPGVLVIRQGYRPRVSLPTPKGSVSRRSLARSAHLHAMEGGRKRPSSAGLPGGESEGGSGEYLMVTSPSKSVINGLGGGSGAGSNGVSELGVGGGRGDDVAVTGRFASPELIGTTMDFAPLVESGIQTGTSSSGDVFTTIPGQNTQGKQQETRRGGESDVDVDEELDGDGWRTDDGSVVGSASEAEEELLPGGGGVPDILSRIRDGAVWGDKAVPPYPGPNDFKGR